MKNECGAILTAMFSGLLLACAPAPTPEPGPAPETEPMNATTVEVTDLEGTQWIAVSIGGLPAAEGVQTTISFQADGKVGGSAGCNSYLGSWAAEGDAITFGHLGATKMMCPPPRMDQEDRFFGALGQAERFAVVDGHLLIYSTGQPDPIRLAPLEEVEK